MKKRIAILCCLMMLLIQVTNNTKVIAATNYSGEWSNYSDIGDYGMDEMRLIIKDNGKKVSVEASEDIFIPRDDTRESYINGIGKMRSHLVYGSVNFNTKGQASFNFKDDYNNGKMNIQLQKDYIQITWKGNDSSEYSFPNGTFKLYKKIKVTSAESKKMGVFLSNFTEVFLDRFDSKQINNTDLIHFGIWHNYMNNYDTRISGTKEGLLFISKNSVEDSIYKYFNIQFKNHKSVDGYKYNGKGYTFDGADGAQINYVKVETVYDLGQNKLRLSGKLYNPEDDTAELQGQVEAVVIKVDKNEIRYVLEKLTVKN
ncbi:hypothetical protein [Paenibacillus anaericanus]|nr:hypothetical protein [Paenibacillus anaericanus]